MSPGPEGVLALDKPGGPTSHDVVASVRRALDIRRVGHTGTLDPFATGLLLVCVGSATRLSEYLTGLDKEYHAVACLGVTTDTLDPEGTVVAESDAWRKLSRADLDAALQRFRGAIQQVPPQYSAKKVAGEAMHRRVRRGETVTLPPRSVEVHALEVLGVDLPRVHLRVRCSSGTYVRALARDLGEALGTGGHLAELRRTAVGRFDVADAVPVARLQEEGALEDAWMSPLDAVAHLPTREVEPAEARALAQGRRIPVEDADEAVLVVACNGVLVAMAEISDGLLRPRKVLAVELARS